jgi:hypothetical protein
MRIILALSILAFSWSFVDPEAAAEIEAERQRQVAVRCGFAAPHGWLSERACIPKEE